VGSAAAIRSDEAAVWLSRFPALTSAAHQCSSVRNSRRWKISKGIRFGAGKTVANMPRRLG
jgi:hypothetical protein